MRPTDPVRDDVRVASPDASALSGKPVTRHRSASPDKLNSTGMRLSCRAAARSDR